MIPTLPLAVLFIPYALFLILYFFFLFFNIHHLRQYGIKGITSHGIGTIFLLGTVIILGISAVLLSRYNWSQPMDPEPLLAPFHKTDLIKPL